VWEELAVLRAEEDGPEGFDRLKSYEGSVSVVGARLLSVRDLEETSLKVLVEIGWPWLQDKMRMHRVTAWE
jgi:hypothetical protein